MVWGVVKGKKRRGVRRRGVSQNMGGKAIKEDHFHLATNRDWGQAEWMKPPLGQGGYNR